MKRFITLALASLSLFIFSASCSKEVDIWEVENEVTYKFYTNTPGQPVVLMDCVEGPYLIVKENWERTIRTKNQYVGMDVTCEDPYTLLTCEIYVNGKLRRRKQGNRRVYISIVLKGNPI